MKILVIIPCYNEQESIERVVANLKEHAPFADYLIVNDCSRDNTEIIYADCDLNAMEDHRRMWPFFRDRRIDSYSGIMERFHD